MKLKISAKNKLSNKLINFLPILKSSIEEIEEFVKEAEIENPLIEVKYSNWWRDDNSFNSSTEIIENRALFKNSVFDDLFFQIETSKLFPTEKSETIAKKIVEYLDEEGYFVGDVKAIAKELNFSEKEVEQVRKRFSYLEPVGVGAKDMKESFIFQLDALEIEDEKLYLFTKELIQFFEYIENYKDEPLFKDALRIIQQFNLVPFQKYTDNQYVIPDVIVLNFDGKIEIKLNEEFYPKIEIKSFENCDNFVKIKLKEAKNLIEALELRKSTLYKISLMIVELQYQFFMGGMIKPMKLRDVAEELGYALSTISRAINNKYILSNRGIVPMKYFFSKEIDENLSNREIKEYIKELIRYENREKPLNDEKITALVNQKFNVKLVRRTISKYRESLNISTSRQRKREYQLSNGGK